ncbi:unnamed protein product, partial [marine sediment metagenome]
MSEVDIWTLVSAYRDSYPAYWDQAVREESDYLFTLSPVEREKWTFPLTAARFGRIIHDAGFMPDEDHDLLKKLLKDLVPLPPITREAEWHEQLLRRMTEYCKVAFDASLKAIWPTIVRVGRTVENVGRIIISELWDWLRENVPEFFAWLWEKLKPARDWLRENVPLFLDWIWGHVKATFEQYWPPIEEAIEKGGRTVFDWTVKNLLHGGEVTPEMAPGMAAKMFGVALTAGITAHLASVG